MSSNCPPLSRCGKPSRRSLAIPVGQLAYWSAVAVIFVWAAWLRFRLPLDPIADHGTWGYLSPALRKLTGAEFGHTYGRNFIYPGFIYLLLLGFGDFRASQRPNTSLDCWPGRSYWSRGSDSAFSWQTRESVLSRIPPWAFSRRPFFFGPATPFNLRWDFGPKASLRF